MKACVSQPQQRLYVTHACFGARAQERVGEVEHALYGAARAKEEAAKRAALQERAARRAAEREKMDRAKQWGDEEVRMLEKALDKFPQARALLGFFRVILIGLSIRMDSCFMARVSPNLWQRSATPASAGSPALFWVQFGKLGVCDVASCALQACSSQADVAPASAGAPACMRGAAALASCSQNAVQG
jgi:hypothetical protein